MFTRESILSSIYAPILASLVAAYCATVYWNALKKHRFWFEQGVKGEWLLPYWGPLIKIFTKDRLEAERQLSEKYGKIYIETNLNGDPRLIIADPEVIRQVLIKDFDRFTDHQVYPYANKYQQRYLIWLKGDHWRRVRGLMSPSFTSVRIKRMLGLLSTCADDLIENFREQSSRAAATIVDLNKIYTLFTIDCIATCAYGIKLKRAEGDSSAQSASGRDAFIKDMAPVCDTSLWRLAYAMTAPRFLLKWINFQLNPVTENEPLIRRIEELVRRRQQQSKSAQRPDDWLQLMVDAEINDELELNELDQMENHHANLTHESLFGDQRLFVDSVKKGASSGEQTKLSNLEVLSEAIFMLIAGMETTRTLLTNCSYALAFNQHVQDKLVDEVRKIAKVSEGARGPQYEFTYEDITGCEYLDAVISETLRILPPALRVNRLSNGNYTIEKYNVLVPAGTQIFAGIYAVQNSAEFWENPHEFNPERFMPENRHKIVPGSYLPFGLGPRHCVGMRFGLTEAKIGLAKAVMNFRFEPAPGLKFPPKALIKLNVNSIKNPYAKILARC